ncbi:glycosyltransferase family 2 protein [Paraflavitalea pollutisoli]|uniref:glycosyltransferase family 2 protein n=1 Tax=Paraflavitalea pollutisoli TaxID=3034143 RepID=UPI0023EAB295|nr:glycosyltransferase family 2 protein [Paraflavitalea sp. H1-2-19X]
MKISIDVVIPSFRPAIDYLLSILQLKRPANTVMKFFLIIDDPLVKLPPELVAISNQEDVSLVRNEQNLGAPASRNKGIDMGTGDWILLLDDDVHVPVDLLEIYAAAIMQHPTATGFIGLVELPPASKAFTQAICATGAMDIFTIARRQKEYAWGATANLLISRHALGTDRFSLRYPAAGGGEDVDLLLRVREKQGGVNYQCLPAAAVTHPWWAEEKPMYRRTFRYGVGNSWLGQLNPRYTYRDFFNTPEVLFLALLALVPLFIFKLVALCAWLFFVGGVLLIEVLATTIQALKRSQVISIAMLWYVILLRWVYECGVLWGNLKRGRLTGLGERFHDDGRVQRIFFYRLNTRKTIKWILYPVLIYCTLYYFL